LAAFVILFTFKNPAAAKQADATIKEKLLQMDFLGTALTLGASLALVLALQYGGITHPWNSSVVIGLLVGSGVMIFALVLVEIWQGERSMLAPRLMRQKTVWVNFVWGFFFVGAYFITLYYLPIYFQSIDNRSPIGSGVRNIPLIAFFTVATFASGKAITKTGTAAGYLLASSVVVTISAGLLYTLDIGTSTGKWVGYQILAGFGYGLGFQVPIVIAQAFAAPSDMASVTAIMICTFPSTIFVGYPETDCVSFLQSVDLSVVRF
jgi:MFS family permease